MKKKSVLIVAFMILIALSLTACGGGSDAKGTSENFLNAIISEDENKAVELSSSEVHEQIKLVITSFKQIKEESENIKIEINDLKVEENEDSATAEFKFAFSDGENSMEQPGIIELKKVDDKWVVQKFAEQ